MLDPGMMLSGLWQPFASAVNGWLIPWANYYGLRGTIVSGYRSMEEQDRRFQARISDPLRQWKLSPMDVESYARWYDYSHARDEMLAATDVPHARWHILRSDDKKRARLNGITHILSLIPYERIEAEEVELPKRKTKREYDDRASIAGRQFVPERY